MLRISMTGEGFADVEAELITLEGGGVTCRDVAGGAVARYGPGQVASIAVLPPPTRSGSSRASAEFPNAYRRWSEEDEQELVAAFQRGDDIPEIAETLGRRVGGVRSRLIMLGLVEPEPGDRLSFPGPNTVARIERPRLLVVGGEGDHADQGTVDGPVEHTRG